MGPSGAAWPSLGRAGRALAHAAPGQEFTPAQREPKEETRNLEAPLFHKAPITSFLGRWLNGTSQMGARRSCRTSAPPVATGFGFLKGVP